MNKMRPAIFTREFFRILLLRDSKRKNGTTKWKKTRKITTVFHPPAVRRTYQTISSGRLPDHMMRNCENVAYIQNTTKPCVSLPRSWKCFSVATLESGSCLDNHVVK